MTLQPKAKKILIWVAFCSLVFFYIENQDRIKQIFFTPKADDLNFNQTSDLTATRPTIVSSDEQININVFEKSHESVVNILTTTLSMNYWREVSPQQGQGTGFIIDKRGYVVTNNHVIGDAEQIVVNLDNGKKVEAILIGKDITHDIAILKIPESVITKVAELGDSNSILIGQKAIAIGNPFGLSHTITTGIVSATGRELHSKESRTLYDLIQTDCAINPGNSGGPLLNSNGEVVGMNTSIYSLSGGSQGIGFAIPVNKIKEVATQLITEGKYAKPWIGISGISLSPEFSQVLEISTQKGVLVVSVTYESPAFQAGIKGGNREIIVGKFRLPIGGDIIVSVNGNSVEDMKSLIREIHRYKVGDTISFSIIRDNVSLDIPVTLTENPVP